MREEYITDPQGRRVRKKHAIRNNKQLAFWVDIEDPETTTEQIEEALQARRAMVFTDCRQLKNDMDSYNENWNREDPIQMSFDFTEDLAESEQPVEYDGITV